MKNYYLFILIIFALGLLFWDMEFGHILGIELYIRYLKLFFLFTFIFFSLKTIQIKNAKQVTYFYIIPILFYLFGATVNIFLSTLSDFSFIKYISDLIPMFLALGIPYIMYKLDNKLFISSTWTIFNRVLFSCISISIIEYALALSGRINLKEINIRGTEYLSGFTSIFHQLSDGEIHLRFYGAFGEPGVAGMIMIPALVYSLVRGNYIFSTVYIVAIFLTKSLGSFISLAMLPLLFIILKSKRESLKISFLAIFLVLCTLYSGNIEEFYSAQIDNRFQGDSGPERIDNIVKPIRNIDKLITRYPLGIKKEKDTLNLLENKLFFGNNFSLVKAFNEGGFLSFLGFFILLATTYSIVIFQLIFKKTKSNYDIIFIISLILLFPYIFQRSTIIDYFLFGFLYSPYIIIFFNKNRLINKKL